jgi:hypothetical protein
MSLFRIPKDGRSVLLVAMAWWVLMPIAEGVFYYTNTLRGENRGGPDLICPVALFVLGWVVIAPAVFGLVWFCLRRYPGAVSLFAFDTARPVWSGVWTLALLSYLYSEIAFFYASIRDRYPMDLMTGLIEVYLMLCLRSSVIYSTSFTRKGRKNQADRPALPAAEGT